MNHCAFCAKERNCPDSSHKQCCCDYTKSPHNNIYKNKDSNEGKDCFYKKITGCTCDDNDPLGSRCDWCLAVDGFNGYVRGDKVKVYR